MKGVLSMRLTKIKSGILVIGLIIALMLAVTGCGGSEKAESKPTLTFADAGWESIVFHNDVAQFILEKGYGYPTESMTGTTPVTFLGLQQGDIDIYMEVWTDNIADYNEAVESGKIKEVSVNFDDDYQGLYVPTYLIKGDPERGIEALAPDLKTVEDLAKYWEIFRDPEDKSKGRIYGAIPGWAVDEIVTQKVNNYGLNKQYNIFRPGSEAALSTSIVQAYEKGLPWVGYYWEPTWIIGKYDMTLLEEAPYDQSQWEKDYKTAFPAVRVTVAVNKDLPGKAPEVAEFLSKYRTSSLVTSEALAYMQDNNVGTKEAAKWFLINQKDMWKKWVPEDVAQKVEAALK